LGMQENALQHVKVAGGPRGEGTDRVVGVMTVETGEEDFTLIGDVIAVGVDETDEAGLLGKDHAAVGLDRKTDG